MCDGGDTSRLPSSSPVIPPPSLTAPAATTSIHFPFPSTPLLEASGRGRGVPRVLPRPWASSLASRRCFSSSSSWLSGSASPTRRWCCRIWPWCHGAVLHLLILTSSAGGLRRWRQVRLDLADPPAVFGFGHGHGMEPQMTRSRTAATREAAGATTTLAATRSLTTPRRRRRSRLHLHSPQVGRIAG